MQINKTAEWKVLENKAEEMNRAEKHLKHLLKDEHRLARFSASGGGLFYDFSRQRLDDGVLDALRQLAGKAGLLKHFTQMAAGQKVNTTEHRAALHTAARSFSNEPVTVDGADVMPAIRAEREKMKAFSEKVRRGVITGSTAKPFTDAVIIGIGGSYLGTEFVSRALAANADGLRLHFLANVDVHNFGRIAAQIDLETTLWVVISKSYTTAETMANAHLAEEFMRARGIDPAKHTVSVTAKGSPGDDPDRPLLASFYMFDFIGGRYSVTSAVGGAPLSLQLGYQAFEQFLKGAEEMDRHVLSAPVEENLPLTAALIGIWNNNFLGYDTQGVIPYAAPLEKFAPHVQQLYMESNGKSATADGRTVIEKTGVIVFGEPGTNAQHSFFQLAHQGRPFPIDFIGVVRPQYGQYTAKSRGVTNHQELWANLIAQPMALALGKESEDAARYFSGNRPSSTILLPDLSPESIGRLLSFYEARTVFEAFVWNINPFDQFGVELGKKLADGIRKEMAAKNENPGHSFKDRDPIERFYLERLFAGRL